MVIYYRLVDGEKIYCCLECNYYLEKDKCEKTGIELGHSHGPCPPNSCPFTRGQE